MDIAVQIITIALLLFSGAAGFTFVGKTPTTSRTSDVGWGFFVYGVLTIAFVIWWETPDLSAVIAQWVVFALLWVPWVQAVHLMRQSKPRVPTTAAAALINAGSCAIMISMILGYWH